MTIRLLFCLFLFHQAFALDFDPLKTTKANKAKKEASNAFASQQYDVAISRYKYLLDTLKIQDDKILLNLAHAYMRKADYANAENHYTNATKSLDHVARSIAYQQLGILASEKKNKEEAIANFKNALKHDPNNSQARFNYELLLKNKNDDMPKSDDKKDRDKQEKKNEEEKKKDEEQKKDQQNKDQQKKDDKGNKQGGDKGDPEKDDKKGKGDKNEEEKKEDQGKPDDKNKDSKNEGKDKKEQDKNQSDKKDGEGDKSKENKPDEKVDKKGEAEKPTDKGNQKKNTQQEVAKANKEQLQKMNMTEQQAKAILNAMRQGETQYIQEMKRVPSKPNSGSNKKDW